MAIFRTVGVLAIVCCCACSAGGQSVTLQFPEDADLGVVRMVEDPNCFTCGSADRELGRARGRVEVRLPAAHWYVSLEMPKRASALMPGLAHPSLAGLGGLDLKGTDVRDGDLRHIAHIPLRSIDLSGTRITGAGLGYIRPDPKWIFVYLRDCPDLKPEHLAHFKGFERATITVAGGAFGAEKSPRQEALLSAAAKAICGGRSERECGTQIR